MADSPILHSWRSGSASQALALVVGMMIVVALIWGLSP